MVLNKKETKNVYVYDENGKYVKEKILDWTDRSPISGNWQIPASMTETAIPAVKEGYDLYWNGKAWEYREIPKEEEPAQPEETVSEQSTAYVDANVVELAETLALMQANYEERLQALEDRLKTSESTPVN